MFPPGTRPGVRHRSTTDRTRAVRPTIRTVWGIRHDRSTHAHALAAAGPQPRRAPRPARRPLLRPVPAARTGQLRRRHPAGRRPLRRGAGRVARRPLRPGQRAARRGAQRRPQLRRLLHRPRPGHRPVGAGHRDGRQRPGGHRPRRAERRHPQHPGTPSPRRRPGRLRHRGGRRLPAGRRLRLPHPAARHVLRRPGGRRDGARRRQHRHRLADEQQRPVLGDTRRGRRQLRGGHALHGRTAERRPDGDDQHVLRLRQGARGARRCRRVARRGPPHHRRRCVRGAGGRGARQRPGAQRHARLTRHGGGAEHRGRPADRAHRGAHGPAERPTPLPAAHDARLRRRPAHRGAVPPRRQDPRRAAAQACLRAGAHPAGRRPLPGRRVGRRHDRLRRRPQGGPGPLPGPAHVRRRRERPRAHGHGVRAPGLALLRQLPGVRQRPGARHGGEHGERPGVGGQRLRGHRPPVQRRDLPELDGPRTGGLAAVLLRRELPAARGRQVRVRPARLLPLRPGRRRVNRTQQREVLDKEVKGRGSGRLPATWTARNTG
ncbi:putative Uncharacterized 50.6 kDa protein in the 5\\'region of gyrA and gyrB [Actinacidiphila cocklensis]|uniref:Uncharacterized 50.6 kDa protein in the 5\'region of gyrA and gyrB n=1 Tax=Actinacidiphila cocklensis TaxID=887465 RepID=A0A9W4GN09_9ACTN|nr:putative Uncharacterized 50.6 kDa protein in the 5\\'region of gyrA and gyrB [Actinacidiphila cocklensis]